ncbi:hypothetical protein MicloDRAFT_00046090 [Microvirga lotononidis]|uniref:Uncharacterized protein n=2 Tax=Microvirga lotononidis TaxID=864069 RepID=I4YVP0_9HYPH|nr:hypothetical protein MicloDRAFT_00046090 [Microvirga lotononidis]
MATRYTKVRDEPAPKEDVPTSGQGTELVLTVPGEQKSRDFSFLIPLFGLSAAQSIARSLISFYRKRAPKTRDGDHLIVCRAFRWMAAAPSLAHFWEETLAKNGRVSEEGWQDAINIWAAYFKAQENLAKRSIAQDLFAFCRCIEHVASAGLLPRVTRPRMPPGYRRASRKRKSLAEVSMNGADGDVDSVTRTLREGILAGEEDSQSFLNTLRDTNVTNCSSIDDLIKAIQHLNAYRLQAIRDIAETAFLKWSAVFDEGQALARQGDDVSWLIVQALQADRDRRYQLIDAAFPPWDLQQSKANFARYIRDIWGSLCPTEITFGDRPTFRRLMIRFGGRDVVKAWLAAHEDAVAGAVLMYLVDSGANVSTALSLPPNFEQPSDEPGHVRISAQKDRPIYKAIVDTFLIDDPSVQASTVQALRKLKEMTAPFRERDPSLGDRLFVQRFFESPAAANSDFVKNRMTYLLRLHPQLSKVPLRPNHIRSSVLLDATLNLEGGIVAARAIGDHEGYGVTEGYTMKWPTRLVYLKMISDFQTRLQIVIIYNIPGAIESLGITPDQAEELYKTAVRTGLGFSCRDPKAGARPGTHAGEICTQIEDCTRCHMILFQATAENVADIILFRDHLLSHQDEWQAQREERWNQVWLPYLALCFVVMEKIRRSPHATLIRTGEQLAAEWKASGYQFSPLF